MLDRLNAEIETWQREVNHEKRRWARVCERIAKEDPTLDAGHNLTSIAVSYRKSLVELEALRRQRTSLEALIGFQGEETA